MKEQLNIALLQVNTIWEDVEENFLLINELLKEINDVDIILLPEVFNTGFTPRLKEFAEDINGGRTLTWMLNTAAKHDSAIGGTIFVKDGDKYYNRFYFVEADGMVSHYDKQHLFSHSFEGKMLSPGTAPKIITYKGWNISLRVCYDLFFNEMNTFVDGQYGYDLIIYSANCPISGNMRQDILTQARAIENQSYSVCVNRVGTDGNGLSYSGNSQVVSATGEYIEYCSARENVVINTTISLSKLNDYRVKFPVGRDW